MTSPEAKYCCICGGYVRTEPFHRGAIQHKYLEDCVKYTQDKIEALRNQVVLLVNRD